MIKVLLNKLANFSRRFALVTVLGLASAACSGKYLVRTYPAGAKVYVKDLQTQDKKLIGTSPVQITEESRLGDVFLLVFEKQNYKAKEVMVRVNEGESLTVSSRLDPLTPDDSEKSDVANNDQKKDDEQKPQQPPQDQDKKKKDWQAEIDDLKLRVALLENTSSFYKDAMFSPRFQGGGPAQFDRDRGDKLIGLMFQGQQAIARGDYPNALATIDKAIQMDEYSANAWLLKGSVKYLMKDMDGARSAWERTLKIDPYNKVAYRYLSEVYKRMGLAPLPENGADVRKPASETEIDKRMRK